jgi:hypothetical protein
MPTATRSAPAVPLQPAPAQPSSLPPAAIENEPESEEALDQRGLNVWLAGFGLLALVQLFHIMQYMIR